MSRRPQHKVTSLGHVVSLSVEREAIYSEMRAEVEESLVVERVHSPKLEAAGHRVFAWDATRLPTHSHYVPVYIELLYMLEAAGKIDPAITTLIETTTGNAGAAIAYVASQLGYPLVIFIPGDMPRTRIDDMRAIAEQTKEWALDIITTPKGRYAEGMVSAFQTFLVESRHKHKGRRLFPVNHSRKPESVNFMAAVSTRVLSRLPAETTIDCCVLAIGNGTTASGIGRAIRGHSPGVKVVGVEPLEAPWFYEQKYPGRFRELYGSTPKFRPHELIGTGGWGVEFPNVDVSLLDDIQLVEEFAWRGALAELSQRQHFVGHSSAACQCVVARRAVLSETPQTFFSVFYDPILKYS